MTLETWIWGSIIILLAVGSVTLPVVTLVDAHRRRIGKEPLNKGKVRNIMIVYKRVTKHDFYARTEPTGNPAGVYRQTSVDFRKVGGKILYTKNIDEELFEQLAVGNTYKVRIRDGCIINIYERIYN